ncbi:hypothetical protein LRP52_35905 [Photobacterium sp. ZSDE20]|uniref:Uncharacterized protein n=1 Tax=Photobacterium pectinilyticum TaxID=2906793 RepID=A0ABT1N9Z1_9GAMM|nr:hypothetical protein [Photobacterium sp. ZSDE20]MCQ1060114.1 hypothetical protein [Photobacterium sp. ZSDE20]MDD1827570.1 hypothetical protein [Photobacterium sp. ZSDE20]
MLSTDHADKLANLKISKFVTDRKLNNLKTSSPSVVTDSLSKKLVEPLDRQLMKAIKQYGKVSHKMLFGFHGVFVDNLVVLKKAGNEWFVRRNAACPVFGALNSYCLSRKVGGDYRMSGFMLISDAVLETLSLERILEEGLQQAKLCHDELNPSAPRALAEIVQLQSSHRRILKQLGITTIDEFERASVEQIIEEIVSKNIGVKQYRLAALKAIVGAKHGRSYRFCADNSPEITYIKSLMEFYTPEPCQEAS